MTTTSIEALELDSLVHNLRATAEARARASADRNLRPEDFMEGQAADAITAQAKEIERLLDHIFGHAEFAEYRIKDGDELGARAWRIALEDIARENRALLTKEPTP